ncbi:hypothetical protein B0J14DRAFT_144659 [Halenospora varia]|nr:hypothetical protein B0J14DRAFT_144659 [Halenospora varia]
MKSAPSAIYNHGMGKDSQRFFKDLDKKAQPWESVVIGRALRDNNNRSIGPLRVPKHKGSRYRFLTWVAFFRGNSPTLSDELKRSCPIVECPRAQKPFDNMNDMLQHVYTCDHLSKGYSKGHYLCPECNQEERISRCHIRGCNNTSSCTNQLVRSTKQLWQSVSGSLRRRSADSIKLSSNYRFAELPAVIPAELQDPQSSLPFELGANASDNFRTNRSELADSSSGWPGHGVLERSQTYPPPNNPYLSKSQSSQQEMPNRSPPPSYAYQNMQDWVAQTPNVGALPHVDDSSHKHYLLQNMYGLEAYVNSNFPAHRPSPLTSPAPEAGQYYTPSPIESHTSSGVGSMMQSPTNISSITSPSEGYLSNLGSGDITGYSPEHSMSQLQNGPRELFSPRESYPNESPIVANYWPAQNAMYNQNFAMPQGSKFFSPEHVGQQL